MGNRQKQQANESSFYEPVGFYLLRAPHLPVQIFKQMTTTPSQAFDKQENWDLDSQLAKQRQQSYHILEQLLADPIINQALTVASSDLAIGIGRIRNGDYTSRRAKQTYAGVFRYLTRMCTRPTPFGLFSGVAVGTLGEVTTLLLGTRPFVRMRTRPDMNWLLSLIQQIEENKELQPKLQVLMNNTVYIAGNRAILPLADIYGKGDNRTITLRATQVFLTIQELTREPLPYVQLRQNVLKAFPRATGQQVDNLLQQLWEAHFLISDLRPPLTSAAPERYLLERLRELPGAETLTSALDEITCLMKEFDCAGIGCPTTLLAHLTEKQQSLVQDQKNQTYQIDAALALEGTQLTTQVGAAIADATEALLRMECAYNRPHLREYHRLFIDRYGIHAEVPLLDLLNPEFGLDAPTTYLEPPRLYPLPQSTTRIPQQERRERLLGSLLVTALHEHAKEIEITDALLEQLAQWSLEPTRPLLPDVEMYVQLHASSREALDRGEWRGVVAPVALAYGGRTFGRFLDLLGTKEIDWLQEYIRREADRFPDTLYAELSYLPKQGRSANVALRPALHTYEIVVNTTPSVPSNRVIALHDLVVGIEQEGFYVRSLSHRKRVIITQSHMLNTIGAPNVCRFLLEVSQDAYPSLSSFHWGALANVPFLPRVVRNKIVLKPAQWNLHPTMIEPIGSGSAEARFFTGLQQWRERWEVPRYVYLQQFDNRLLLDLEHPLSVVEVQHGLQKVGQDAYLNLQEMLPDFDHLWLCDGQGQAYMAEVVVPLKLKETAITKRTTATTQVERARNCLHDPIFDKERLQLPGEDWVFLKLYVSQKQHDEVLSGPLREVVQRLSQQGLFDNWFFIRYADPEPHLRVRFHAANEHDRNELLIKVLAWGRDLVDMGLARNLALESYSREVERYGGPQALAALEEVFTVNSATAVEVIAAVASGQLTLNQEAINIFTLDQIFTFWGLDLTQRLNYLQMRTEKYEQSNAFRSQRQLFCELLQPWDSAYDPAMQQQRLLLARLCVAQKTVVQRVSAFLRTLAARGELWVSEEALLTSLAHMHLNRLQGIDRAQEQASYALWRQTLESIQRRPGQNRGDNASKTAEDRKILFMQE